MRRGTKKIVPDEMLKVVGKWGLTTYLPYHTRVEHVQAVALQNETAATRTAKLNEKHKAESNTRDVKKIDEQDIPEE